MGGQWYIAWPCDRPQKNKNSPGGEGDAMLQSVVPSESLTRGDPTQLLVPQSGTLTIEKREGASWENNYFEAPNICLF